MDFDAGGTKAVRIPRLIRRLIADSEVLGLGHPI